LVQEGNASVELSSVSKGGLAGFQKFGYTTELNWSWPSSDD
jgi:hypothetical protein